jgi:dipeptidyl aminopeptidase/acylaminoacyl peptidase
MSLQKVTRLILALVLVQILILPALPSSAALPQEPTSGGGGEGTEQRPVGLTDTLEWKRINSATVSRDGGWFAYRISPNEGNSEALVRMIGGDTEHRFPIGEVPRAAGFGGGGGGSSLSFSDDSGWLAFTIYPDREEAQGSRTQRRPSRNKVGLVDLGSGEKLDFDDVRRFSFSGETAGWIALHKYAPQAQSGTAGRAAGEASTDNGDSARGSDLILRELSSGLELNVGNVAEFAFDKSGQWLAWIVDTEGRSGNGVQLRNMATGVVMPLDSGDAEYLRLAWTEEGDGLAVLKGVDDDGFEDPLFSVVGFKDFSNARPTRIVYDPGEDESFPAEMTISDDRSPAWTEDLDALLFGIVEVEVKETPAEESEDAEEGEGETEGEGEEEEKDLPEPRRPPRLGGDELDPEEKPDLVIWHWRDERLQSMQQVQENRDENFSFLSVYRVDDDRFIRLADDDVRNVNAAPKQKWALGYDNSRYELLGNLDGRRFNDIYTIDLRTGERKMALEKARWAFMPSSDGTHLLYFDDGDFYTYEFATGESYNITAEVPTSFINTEDDHNIQDPPINPFGWGWTKDGDAVLLYDNWDVWKVDVHGEGAVNLTVDGKDEKIRYRRRFVIDPDEEGIDLSRDIYLAPFGEWTKKSGIARIPAGETGVEELLWADAAFGGLMKAEDADVYLYTKATPVEYPNYYVASASFADGSRITDANPEQSEFFWTSGSRLIDYTSEKGDKLQAALHLPADYEEGKSYPTIVYIYEKLSQGMNSYAQPYYNGFNKSVYTSNGYAVLMPDIVYTINDPGMSAVWCVLPALEAAIATGVVDADRVGLHGHSWGGYQTSFLVTQTQAFAAAVAGAPLTNMISMYSSIYWNSGSGNMSIFESSQGRFTGGYWEAMDAYVRNSPVFFADNVKTPLIILHNDADGAVDWNQGIEYYSTLRRLGKDVIMLQYEGENHGLRKPANMKDYTVRMREFFDHHLKGAEAPEWLLEGVDHLDMEDHLKDRAKLVRPEEGKGEKEIKPKKPGGGV